MIPLIDVPRRLKDKYGVTVPYRRLHGAVVDGRVPAERGQNGRWLLAEDGLEAIAEALGGAVGVTTNEAEAAP